MPRYTRTDLLPPVRLLWLLTVRLRGREYRFGSEATEVSSDDGPLVFLGGLGAVRHSEESGIEDLGETERDVAIELLFSPGSRPGTTGWAALAEGGHDLGDATGELALIREGDAWERREVLFDGRLVEPEYGSWGEPVTFSLVEEPSQDTAQIPGDAATVSDNTWAVFGTLDYSDSAAGSSYPTVFGRPGMLLTADDVALFPGVPAPLVRINTAARDNSTQDAVVVVAGHKCESTGATDSVRVYNMNRYDPTTPAVAYFRDYTPAHDSDDLGRVVTTVTITGTGGNALDVEDGDELYASFLLGGGIRHNGTEARDAASVIQSLLSMSSMRLPPLAPEAAERLRGFNFDFYVNEPASPWAVLRQEVLPFLPVSLHYGPEGVRLVYWNVHATQDDAIDVINPTTRGGERAGPVRFSSADEIANQLRMRFAQRGDTGAFLREITTGPDRDQSASSRYDVNPYSVQSFHRYGLRVGRPIDATSIQDPATARAVLSWMLKWMSQTRRRLAYDLPQHYQYLRPGDVVTVTDSDISLSGAVCLVRSVGRGPGRTHVALETVPDFIRTAPQ